MSERLGNHISIFNTSSENESKYSNFCRFRFSVGEGICSNNIMTFVCVLRVWSSGYGCVDHLLYDMSNELS